MSSMRLLAAGTLVVAACSTFGASETPEPTTDAGASSTSSSSGSSSGGGPVPDGAPPGPADATPNGGRFCSSPAAAGATYCADFEDGLPPADWAKETKGAASMTIVNGGARSGTYAMTTAGMAASSEVGAALAHAIGPRPTAVALAAGVRINTIAGNTNVFMIEMKSDTYVYYALEIEVQDDGTGVLREHRFSSGAPDYDIANKWNFTDKVPFNKWLELSLVLTMTGGTSTASVLLDGKTVATGAPAAHQMTELTDVVFGEPHADANVSWSTSFDDVRITITP